MDRFEILSLVVPAFGALAKEVTGSRPLSNGSLQRDLNDFRSDMVNIGDALKISRGERCPDLLDEVLRGLMKALESRMPKRTLLTLPTITLKYGSGSDKFEKLRILAILVRDAGLGGYDECACLADLPRDAVGKYMRVFNNIRKGFSLFHDKEITFEEKRFKFLKPVREAAGHLMTVYSHNRPKAPNKDFQPELPQQTSDGLIETTNEIFNLLNRHWQCQCERRAAQPYGPRQARISLSKYQNKGYNDPQVTTNSQPHSLTKFEILLPLCKESVEWKVINVESRKQAQSQGETGDDMKPVDRDLCRWLLDSEGCQVDLKVDGGKLWHQKPHFSTGFGHYTAMESLQQVLGDEMINYSPKKKLILCYTLAKSGLLFYPGTGIHSSLDSNNLHFLRQSNSLTPLVLTMPYLSVKVHQAHYRQKAANHHNQQHPHPVILALGIIFLEIATGRTFVRSAQNSPGREWAQFNNDCYRAHEQLVDLDKQSRFSSSGFLSMHFRQVIYACIRPTLPPNFPSNSLSDGSLIQQYISSCIVQPLASDLERYQVSLDDLNISSLSNHETVGSQTNEEHSSASCGPLGSLFKSLSVDFARSHITENASRPFSRGDFEIAVICAVPEEYNAVALVFDEFWDNNGDVFKKTANDLNSYTTGRIGHHNVVLVLLSNMGKVKAATAAGSLRSSYQNLRLVILAGICGGAPGSDPSNHVFLGDVIISKAVEQYDLGRQYLGAFKPKNTADDSLGQSNPNISSLLKLLQTDRGLERLQAESSKALIRIQEEAGRKNYRSYGRPVESKDPLFKPEYLHRHRDLQGCGCSETFACDAAHAAPCDELKCDEYVLRQPLSEIQGLEKSSRSRDRTGFAIHFGNFASGDTVMKSAKDRDRIAEKLGITAFEMEAAGLWSVLPCVVVKGICDYADSHKNKKWQPYAAATAASVARAILAIYVRTDRQAS